MFPCGIPCCTVRRSAYSLPLSLQLPPRQVEVNMHPTKREVGFLHQVGRKGGRGDGGPPGGWTEEHQGGSDYGNAATALCDD